MNSLKELNIFDEGNKIFVYGITNNLVKDVCFVHLNYRQIIDV